MKDKAQKVLMALDSGQITEYEARGLLSALKAKAESEQGPAEYVEESPQELGVIDRAIAESFGANPEAKLAFYKKKYPESDPQLEDGRITFKGEGNRRFYADPDAEGFDGIGEFSRDALEAVVPVGTGLAESVAAGVGGLAGAAGGTALAPGPGTIAGGLAGASLAGAGAGDLIERGRQGVGSMLGIPNNVDADEISTARTFGAVSPLLLGFDKPVRAMRGPLKSLAKQATKEASKENVGRGALGFGKEFAKNKVFPSAASAASAKSKDSIKYLMKNYDEVTQAAKDTPLAEMISGLGNKIQKNYSSRYQKVSKKFGKEADKLTGNEAIIDVAGNVRPLTNVVDKYRDELKDDAIQVIGGKLHSGDDAALLVRNYFDPNPDKKQLTQFKELMKGRDSLKSYDHVNKSIAGRLPVGNKVKVSKAIDLKAKINDLSGVRKNKDAVGMGQLDRDIMNAAKQSAKAIDKKITRLDGGTSFNRAKKEYAKVAKEREGIKKYFGESQKDTVASKTEGTINKLLTGSSEVSKSEIDKAAKSAGVDIMKEGRKIKTIKDFANPSLSPLSDTVATGSRSIPLSLAGGTAGYFAGEAAGGGAGERAAGTVIGTGLGAVAGGPKAIRAYIRMMNNAGKVRRATPMTKSQSANIWSNMNSGEE